MNNLSFTLHRIDLPVQKPLVLGPGLEIHTIPYYCARLTDGTRTGVGWGVSSPLWGGLSHLPLETGIAHVERWLLHAAEQLLTRYNAGPNLLEAFQDAHNELFSAAHWSLEAEPVPPLIRGMILAPLEGALCDYLAQTLGMDMVTFLSTRVAKDSAIFTSKPLAAICPFLTIGGTATVQDVAGILQNFGQRPVVKFKIGSKKDPLAEAVFMAHIMQDALPAETYMVIDNNQAYTAEECRIVVEELKKQGVVERLLFFEQPFKREQEPQDLDKLFTDIAPGLAISLDESVGSAQDITRLGKKLSASYNGNVLFVPKLEKGGFIEIVRMLEEAKRLGIGVTPSTLTGLPAQLPQYWDLFRHVTNILTLPGNPTAFGAEANGYEILNWDLAVKQTIGDSQQSASIFSTTEALLAGSGERIGAWPIESNIKDVKNIPWTNTFHIVLIY